MKDTNETASKINWDELHGDDLLKTAEPPRAQNHGILPDSNSHTANPSAERTTSDDLIGLCQKHVVMFWPDKCFICESRARARFTADRHTEITEQLTATRLTIGELSDRLQETRKQLADRERQIALLQQELAREATRH